jgi:hypothetical protein
LGVLPWQRILSRSKPLHEAYNIVVGVATDPSSGNGGREDMIYLDTNEWSEEDYAEVQELRENLGLFKEGNVKEQNKRHYQYPVEEKRTDN